MFVPDVSLFQRNVIKDVWRGFHRATPSTAAPGPLESRSVRGSSLSNGGWCGLGRVYLPGHPAGSCITSATSSELSSLQCTLQSCLCTLQSSGQGRLHPCLVRWQWEKLLIPCRHRNALQGCPFSVGQENRMLSSFSA